MHRKPHLSNAKVRNSAFHLRGFSVAEQRSYGVEHTRRATVELRLRAIHPQNSCTASRT